MAPRVRRLAPLPATEELLAATAHELRLPLSHIKGFVSSLRRTDITWDEETRCAFLAEIDLETDRLAGVVGAHLGTPAARRSTTPRRGPACTSPPAPLHEVIPPTPRRLR